MQIIEVALMSGKVALKQRQTGSEIPCRWLSRAGVYTNCGLG